MYLSECRQIGSYFFNSRSQYFIPLCQRADDPVSLNSAYSRKQWVRLWRWGLLVPVPSRVARWDMCVKFGIFLKALEWKIRVYAWQFGVFSGHLVYLVIICNLFLPFWCTSKNLATLVGVQADSWATFSSRQKNCRRIHLPTWNGVAWDQGFKNSPLCKDELWSLGFKLGSQAGLEPGAIFI
jgi:hypothetical protein